MATGDDKRFLEVVLEVAKKSEDPDIKVHALLLKIVLLFLVILIKGWCSFGKPQSLEKDTVIQLEKTEAFLGQVKQKIQRI